MAFFGLDPDPKATTAELLARGGSLPVLNTVAQTSTPAIPVTPKKATPAQTPAVTNFFGNEPGSFVSTNTQQSTPAIAAPGTPDTGNFLINAALAVPQAAARFGVSAGEAVPRLASGIGQFFGLDSGKISNASLPAKPIPGLNFLGPIQSYQSESNAQLQKGDSTAGTLGKTAFNVATDEPLGLAFKPALLGLGLIGKAFGKAAAAAGDEGVKVRKMSRSAEVPSLEKAASQEPIKTQELTPATQREQQLLKPNETQLGGPEKSGLSSPKATTPEPVLQTTKNKVELPVRGTTETQKVQSAIANSESVKNQIIAKGQDAYTIGSKLSKEDLKLAEQYESGKGTPELATQAKDPKKFTAFMDKLADYYDFRLAADRAAGGFTKRVENYIPHQWDLSNPSDLAKFNELAKQKGIQPYPGFHSQPRIFKSYAEGESFGFRRQNNNILGDLKKDYESGSTAISRQALRQGLSTAAPEKVSVQGLGRTEKGKAFVNTNIPGLEGMSFHPDINRELKGFQPLNHPDFIELVKKSGAEAAMNKTGLAGAVDRIVASAKSIPENAKEAGFTGVAGSIYDHVSGPMKQVLWNWSGFHSLNITLNHVAASSFHPITGTKGVLQSVGSLLSEKVFQKSLENYKNTIVKDSLGTSQSVLDWALKSGAYEGRSLPTKGVARLNPLTGGQRAIFDREIPVLQLNLAEQAAKKGIIADSPEGRAIGREIQTITGEINNKTMNLNPNAVKAASRIFLAPGFTYSKYKTLLDAFTKFGKDNGAAGSLARTAVIGKSALVGVATTLGTLLATGQFPNLSQLLLDFSVNPSTQTNLTNQKGQKIDITPPKTFVSEGAGALLDPVHYAEARLNPIIADTVKVGTNQDYYGRPIVDPNSKEPVVSQYAKGVGLGHLPIGAQAVTNQLLGKQTTPQTALQIFGLGTRVSANDPVSIKYKGIDNAKASIAKISGADPDRTKKIQEIINGLTPDQRKSLTFQELLDGVSMKGISTSETGITFKKVQQLVQDGKPEEAKQVISAMTDDQYKAYATYKHNFNTNALRELLKVDPAKAVEFVHNQSTNEQQRLLKVMTDDEYKSYEQGK